jgi:hypothetical protein
VVYHGVHIIAEYTDSEPFMIQDDSTYIDVWMQITRTNSTVTYKRQIATRYIQFLT